MNRKLALRLCGTTGTAVLGFFGYKSVRRTFDSNLDTVFASSDVGRQPENTLERETENDLTLKQVQIFFRHGARTPLKTIPNFEQATFEAQLFLSGVPHTLYDYTLSDLNGEPLLPSKLEQHYRKSQLKGGAYSGQLTNLGQDQTYMLGRRLRRRYIDHFGLISDQYDPDSVLPQSTNTQRTVESLRCVVAGLFGVEHLKQKGNIVLYTQDIEKEYLFPNGNHCDFLKKLMHKTLTNYGNIPGVREDRLRLEEVLGIDSRSDMNKQVCMVDIRDDIACRKSHGFLVPEELREFEGFVEQYAVGMMVYANTGANGSLRESVLKLSMGRSLAMVIRKIEAAMQGQNGHKLMLYSCHDTSLVPLLVAMGIYDGKWPPFAADIAVELYEDKAGEYWVKILYQGENVTERGFGSPIVRVSQMKSNLSKYAVDNQQYQRLCQSALPESLQAPDGLDLPEGSVLPDHLESMEESAAAEEKAERPVGM